MRRVLPAPAAVLAQLDAVRRVPLGLGRLIVPALAVGASEGDRVSDSCGHFSFSFARFSSGGRTRTFDLRIMIPLL